MTTTDRENEYENPGGNYPDREDEPLTEDPAVRADRHTAGEAPHTAASDTRAARDAEPSSDRADVSNPNVMHQGDPQPAGWPPNELNDTNDAERLEGIIVQTRSDAATMGSADIRQLLRHRLDDAELTVSDADLELLLARVADADDGSRVQPGVHE